MLAGVVASVRPPDDAPAGRRGRAKLEFGDFQTPPELAAKVCRVVAARGRVPRSIVEPTCGAGSLLAAAIDAFSALSAGVGVDISAAYVAAARAALADRPGAERVRLEQGDFFAYDWPAQIAKLPEPILVIGNPPWVTSAQLGRLQSDNLPHKAYAHGRSGLDAVTGKSNFDISEWMLRELLGWLAGRDAVLAMLCKTAVARKVLAFAWGAGHHIGAAAMYRIDAAHEFGAAVDACLLVCESGPAIHEQHCQLFDRLDAAAASGVLGYRDGAMVADVIGYDRSRELVAHPPGETPWTWRSGIKHDCAAVMELSPDEGGFANRAGDVVDLESSFLYPLLKGSDVARAGPVTPRRWMLVTQRFIGDDTRLIEQLAPRTWRYLARHRERFDRRASSIYRKRPPFAIFGVGDYSFAPWKVAISGLHKKLNFRVVGPHGGKPVVLDDTCYFVACSSEAEANLVCELVRSPAAQELYSALVFWDAKRPITSDLLRRLDLWKLAQRLGRADELRQVRAAGVPSELTELTEQRP